MDIMAEMEEVLRMMVEVVVPVVMAEIQVVELEEPQTLVLVHLLLEVADGLEKILVRERVEQQTPATVEEGPLMQEEVVAQE